MQLYLNLLEYILNNGVDKPDRTGVGVRSVFGYDMRFDLSLGFPLVTTKKCHFKSIVGELLWMLSGSTNINDLHKHKITIWDEWADNNGELGPVYGAQWRNWSNQYDQLQDLVNNLKKDPNSRRHIVSAWNVAEIEQMALAPCHAFMQFYVANNKLSCKLTQRSADVFLGVPFNIASYALLTHMVAQQTNLLPGELIWSGGDCHLYHNHFAQAKLQLARSPCKLPQIKIKKAIDLFNYTLEDFELIDYTFHPHIKAEVAV